MREVTGAAMLALICVGCGASHPSGPSTFEPPRVWAPPPVPPSPHLPGSNDAATAIQLVGILMYNDANGCFLLDWGGGFAQPLVWPAGTVAASDRVGVVLADGHV